MWMRLVYERTRGGEPSEGSAERSKVAEVVVVRHFFQLALSQVALGVRRSGIAWRYFALSDESLDTSRSWRASSFFACKCHESLKLESEENSQLTCDAKH